MLFTLALVISLIFLFGCVSSANHNSKMQPLNNTSTQTPKNTNPVNINPNSIKVYYDYNVGSTSFGVNTKLIFEKLGSNAKITTIFGDGAKGAYYYINGNYITCSGYINSSERMCTTGDNYSYTYLLGLIKPQFNLNDKSSYNLSQNGVKVIAGVKCNDIILKTNQKFWDEQPLWKGSFILPRNPIAELCINKPSGIALLYVIKGENGTVLNLKVINVSSNVNENDFKIPTSK